MGKLATEWDISNMEDVVTEMELRDLQGAFETLYSGRAIGGILLNLFFYT